MVQGVLDGHRVVSLGVRRKAALYLTVAGVIALAIGTNSPTTGGGGLAGMRERLSAFGGEVQFGPRVPQGWAVTARLRVERITAS